jgi:HAD superfamily hydrolase (TIGR01509 family)
LFELVIFDNDGVLVDSESLAVLTDIELLASEGLDITQERIVELFLGRSLNDLIAHAEAELGRSLGDGFERRFHERLFERFETELEAVQGIEEVLDHLDVRSCVASSASHDRVERSLKITGLFDRFAGRVYSSDDVGKGKPEPDLFLHAAHDMGADPTHCVVIEDSPPGVEAARRAGMTVFGYCAMTPASALSDANATFTRMADLPALLARYG